MTKVALQRLSAGSLAVGGVTVICMGLYFIFFRPALLPEDARYIGATVWQVQSTAPDLVPWLHRVFGVLGGFMLSTGLLAVYVAMTSLKTSRPGALTITAISGLVSVGWMAITNFAIDSDFKWVLLIFTVPWVLTLGLSWASETGVRGRA